MFHNETIDKITYSFEGFKSDGLTNTRTDQEIIYFHIDSNFPLGSNIVDKFEKHQGLFHLSIVSKAKLEISNRKWPIIHAPWTIMEAKVQHPALFLSPPKESGSRIFSTPLPLSLPSPSSHPYTLSCPTSQRNPPRLPSYVCVPSNRSPASLVNRSLSRDTKNYSNKFTIRGRRRSYRHNPFENSMISSIIIPLFSNVQRVYLKRRAEPFSR